MAENILSLNNIRKSFGTLDVLKDISISVDQGEVVSIIGSSGSLLRPGFSEFQSVPALFRHEKPDGCTRLRYEAQSCRGS